MASIAELKQDLLLLATDLETEVGKIGLQMNSMTTISARTEALLNATEQKDMETRVMNYLESCNNDLTQAAAALQIVKDELVKYAAAL